MKLTAIILLSACMMASAKGNTQGVSLSLHNVSLEKAFKEIKKQTGYSFIYGKDLIGKAEPVSIEVKNASLTQVLDLVFKNQALSYKISENYIVVSPKDPSTGSGLPNADAIIINSEPPPIDITGKVTDENGNPLAGASVKVKGTNKGTTTNNDGVFVLKGVDENAVLEISYVGFEQISIAVSSRTSIVTSLKAKPENLSEVVINKGYYTEKQKYSVGNATHIDGKVIEKQPVQNPLLALEGRVPGLFITQASGVANGNVVARIQGQNSIQSQNDPFIVIDGVPFTSQFQLGSIDGIFGNVSGTAISPLSFLNPSDIESIDILKDADATAVYGSRAANGAILITTKRGRIGKMKLDLDLQQGWGQVHRKVKLLNTRQYLDMRYEAFKNDGIDWTSPAISANDLKLWDTTRYTDWQKVLIGNTAKISKVTLSIYGGTSAVQYSVAANYHRETTVFPGSFSDQKGSIHMNLTTSSSNEKVRFQTNATYLYDDNKLPGGADLTQYALGLEPDAPSVYNDDGSINWAPNSSGSSSWVNPIAAYTLRKLRYKTSNLIANFSLIWKIANCFELKTNTGYNSIKTNGLSTFPATASRPEERSLIPRSTNFVIRDLNNWSFEPQLTYNNSFGQGVIAALLGASIQQNNSDFLDLKGQGFISDLVLEDLKAAPTITTNNSSKTMFKYNALFGRLNYNWKEKYIVNGTIRRDGSSRFGAENRFHNFWGLGVGWIFTNESQLQKLLSFLSSGKLKASFGTTGNDQIQDYSYLSSYFSQTYGIPYQGVAALSIGGFSNPYLQWEETHKLQLGIELGFAKEQMFISIAYARNRSSNQLLSYVLPSITGGTSISSNFPATVENTSWEFVINSTNIKHSNFNWNTSINLTIPRNRLKSFPNLSTSTYANQLAINQPINVIRTFQFLGVNPATGVYIKSDKNGNPVASPSFPSDYTTFIDANPKYYGGIENKIFYKGFQIDFLFQLVNQIGRNDFYFSGFRTPGNFASSSSNQPVTVLNRWQKSGDLKSIQRFSTSNLGTSVGSAFYNDNVFFARLKSFSIGKQLPTRWLQKMHVQNITLNIEAQNLFTITRYKGLDPENQNPLVLPPLKIISGGMRVTL